MKLEKRITSNADLEKWKASETYSEVIGFVQDLQNAVLGLTNDAKLPKSEVSNQVLDILQQVESIYENNPVKQDKDVSRFGKVEFRDFYDQVAQEAPKMVQKFTNDEETGQELAGYLVESWGNRTRIDYGSGHELNFVCFLFCLKKIGVLTQDEHASVVLQGFTKYIAIMRILQKHYWLEPAGSHGVWGLDDYHFLPFLFGASQLATHPYMKPKSIHNDELVETYYKQYMYFECIHFINSIKTVPNNQQKLSIRWHSPMLDDISSAKSWAKIKDGMIKMYRAEVMEKLPIIQHFMFGDLIKCPQGVSAATDGEEDDHGHHHGHSHELNNTWGDCCGIKIPSAIAASESLKLQKRIPFD